MEAICLKALAKRPEDRYANARELAAALEQARNSFRQMIAAGCLNEARACISRSEYSAAEAALIQLQDVSPESREAQALMAELRQLQKPTPATAAATTRCTAATRP